MNPNEQVRTKEEILDNYLGEWNIEHLPMMRRNILKAMTEHSDQQCAERDERIKELEEENERLRLFEDRIRKSLPA